MLLDRAVRAAKDKVILCESTRGLNLSDRALPRAVSRVLLAPGVPFAARGLGLETLERLAAEYGALRVSTEADYFLAVLPGVAERAAAPQTS